MRLITGREEEGLVGETATKRTRTRTRARDEAERDGEEGRRREEEEEEKAERTHISGTYARPSVLASFHSVHSSCVATTKTYFAPLSSAMLSSLTLRLFLHRKRRT